MYCLAPPCSCSFQMSGWGGSEWSGGGSAWGGSAWGAASNGDSPASPEKEKWSSGSAWGSMWGAGSWGATPASSSTHEPTPAASSQQSVPAASQPSPATSSQQGAQKRAQSAPPTPAVPPRQDKWWLGVDAETRKKYTEEMREWLRSIDPSFTFYFKIIEDNYDTVDQICRLYAVDSKKTNPASKSKYVDPLFFDDNKISDLEHRRLFKQWFARRMGLDFVDDSAPAASSPATVATGSSAPSVPMSPIAHATPATVSGVTSPAAGSTSTARGYAEWASLGASWSGEAWKGSSWGERASESDEKGAAETAWTGSSWGGSEWNASEKWK